MKKATVFVILTLIAAVMLGGAAIAYAAPGVDQITGHGPGGRGAGGEVTAVDGTTITAENPRGTVTILTDESTEFTINGEAGSLSDVEVGQFVRAEGTRNDDGTFSASRVLVSDELPARPEPGRGGSGGRGAGGEVTAVDSTTITAENPRGTETILTDDDTEFTVNGEAGSLSDVEVGQFVRAEGTRNDDGTFSASRVLVSDELPARPEPDHNPGQRPGKTM